MTEKLSSRCVLTDTDITYCERIIREERRQKVRLILTVIGNGAVTVSGMSKMPVYDLTRQRIYQIIRENGKRSFPRALYRGAGCRTGIITT